MNIKVIAVCTAMSAMLPAMADVSINMGTANATAAGLSTFTFDLSTLAITANTADSLGVDLFAVSGTPSLSAGSLLGSVTVSLQAARPINTTDGTGTALTAADSYTANALGLGVRQNPDGNFLGSDGSTYEGIQLSVDASSLGSGYVFQLLGYGINASGTAAYSSGLINALTSTSENFGAIGVGGGQTFVLNSPLALAGGNGSTFLGTFWQPDDAAGYRLRTITLDIIPIPEPSSVAIAGLGLFGLAWSRRIVKKV